MPISEWWVKSQLTRLIKNVSTSSHGALVCSIHTLLQKLSNMISIITGLLFTLVLIILGGIDEIK